MPDNLSPAGIIVPTGHALHAYIPFQLAVKSSQAQCSCQVLADSCDTSRPSCKDKTIIPHTAIFPCFSYMPHPPTAPSGHPARAKVHRPAGTSPPASRQRCAAKGAKVRPGEGAHPPEKSQAAGRRSVGKAEKTSWQWEDNRTRNVIFANGCLPTTADKAFRPKHALTQLGRRKAHNHRKDTV